MRISQPKHFLNILASERDIDKGREEERSVELPSYMHFFQNKATDVGT